MFCNKCGSPLEADYRVCPRCGNPIQGAISAPPTYVPPARGRVSRHIQTLGILWIIVGAFWLIPAIAMMALGTVAHVFIPFGGGIGRALGPALLHVAGFGFLFVAAAAFMAGWGLMQRRPWARTLAIVLGFLALFHPPFATALGIYTLWVLLPSDSAQEYTQIARAA
ncbi:MAG TPA: zinc ribbon domain-containing protein [Terriglobales bacterium]